MDFLSKWGRSGQWEVEYLLQPGESVQWEIRERGKRNKREGRIDAVMGTLTMLLQSSPTGVHGSQVVELMMKEGMSKPSVYRHLKTLVDEEKLKVRIEGNGKIYELCPARETA